MHQPPILFAAGFDWFEALAGSAVLFIWIISQVINLLRAAGKNQAPAGRRPPPPVAVTSSAVPRRLKPTPAAKPPPLPRPAALLAERGPQEGSVARHVADAFGHELDQLSSGLSATAAGAEQHPQPVPPATELAAALRCRPRFGS